MIGVQGILNFTFLYLITSLFIISCSTDATPIYSSIPDGTTNTPQSNSFEWADYSINFCEENDSTLHFTVTVLISVVGALVVLLVVTLLIVLLQSIRLYRSRKSK